MIPLQEFQKRPRVLTVGGGLTALEAASQLIALGYEVLVAYPQAEWSPVYSLVSEEQALGGYARDLIARLGTQGKLSFFPNTRILAVNGFAGDFEVRLQSPQKEWDEAVGAILLAPELAAEAEPASGPWNSPRQIVPLDHLVQELSDLPGASRQGLSLKSTAYAAFLIGLDGAGAAADMAQALKAALILRQEFESQVYFFTAQVKVAEEGLERLYLECREAGVVFFKMDREGPEWVAQGDQVTLRFTDPLLGQPFELTPDLLVIQSRPTLPAEMRSLAVSARLGMDRTGHLQSANVHLWPYGLERTGIFAAGPGKGPRMASAAVEEGRGAALTVHQFFEGVPAEPLDCEVVVDKGLCTVCLTCLRYCPHQAIGWTHRIFIHPLACRRCGICASECPMDAIQITGYSDAEVEQRLGEISEQWAKEAAGEPRIVVFGCRRSAGVAWEEARGAGRGARGAEKQNPAFMENNPESVAFIGLPCAGKLDTDVLLKALALGATGVLVLACPEENCRSLHGNTYARLRMDEARDYLQEAGIDRRRIHFENLSSNKVHRFVEVLEQFSQALKTGPDGTH